MPSLCHQCFLHSLFFSFSGGGFDIVPKFDFFWKLSTAAQILSSFFLSFSQQRAKDFGEGNSCKFPTILASIFFLYSSANPYASQAFHQKEGVFMLIKEASLSVWVKLVGKLKVEWKLGFLRFSCGSKLYFNIQYLIKRLSLFHQIVSRSRKCICNLLPFNSQPYYRVPF